VKIIFYFYNIKIVKIKRKNILISCL